MAISSATETMHKVLDLQKDMNHVNAMVDRLDVTIEKLTEVSTAVSQLLAVHGSRIDQQEKAGERLQIAFDQRRLETEGFVKDLHNKVDRVEKDLRIGVEESYDEIIKKISELDAKTTKQLTELNDRYTKSERFMYLCVGGAAVIMWVLNQIDISRIL